MTHKSPQVTTLQAAIHSGKIQPRQILDSPASRCVPPYLGAVQIDQVTVRGRPCQAAFIQVKMADVKIPVIVITGITNEETRVHAMELGAQGYLTKPFDPKVMIDLVKTLSGKN